MKAWNIVGYTYRAEIVCPDCVVTATHHIPNGNPAGRKIENAEMHMDILARIRGVNREDESSFDSDYFPKVIFASDASGEECGGCGEKLI